MSSIRKFDPLNPQFSLFFQVQCSLTTLVSPERVDQWQAPYLDPANIADLCEFVGESCKLALLLDYDGTLAPVASHPDLAVLPELTRQVLIRLSRTSNVAVCVMSGRSVADLKRMVDVPGITYAGNQGLEVLHPDGSHFIHPLPEDHTDKLDRLLVALQVTHFTHERRYSSIGNRFVTLKPSQFSRYVILAPDIRTGIRYSFWNGAKMMFSLNSVGFH